MRGNQNKKVNHYKAWTCILHLESLLSMANMPTNLVTKAILSWKQNIDLIGFLQLFSSAKQKVKYTPFSISVKHHLNEYTFENRTWKKDVKSKNI